MRRWLAGAVLGVAVALRAAACGYWYPMAPDGTPIVPTGSPPLPSS